MKTTKEELLAKAEKPARGRDEDASLLSGQDRSNAEVRDSGRE